MGYDGIVEGALIPEGGRDLDNGRDYLMAGEDIFASGDEKRRMLSENIMGSLSVCSVQQLGCMEQIARLYVEGIVNKE